MRRAGGHRRASVSPDDTQNSDDGEPTQSADEVRRSGEQRDKTREAILAMEARRLERRRSAAQFKKQLKAEQRKNAKQGNTGDVLFQRLIRTFRQAQVDSAREVRPLCRLTRRWSRMPSLRTRGCCSLRHAPTRALWSRFVRGLLMLQSGATPSSRRCVARSGVLAYRASLSLRCVSSPQHHRSRA